MHTGALLPFGEGEAPPTVRYQLWRQRQQLRLDYQVSPLDGVVWPPPSSAPERRDGLWTSTCLECFFARPGHAAYWEVNLSPAGDWDAYAFDRYRSGMRRESRITGIHSPGGTGMRVDLASLGLDDVALEVAICTILKLESGQTRYYALAHPAARPNFHRREAFTLHL